MIVAREVRSVLARRASRVSSPTSAPARLSSSRAPDSICQMSRRAAGRSRAADTAPAWVAVSTTTATAPESSRIQATWSGDDVS